jgi:hypothetical protein
MHDERILVETIAGIEEILAGDLDCISVERVAIGLFFTGVKLNTGSAGACATPLRSIPEGVRCPSSAMSCRFPASCAAGQSASCCGRPRSPVASVAPWALRP